MAKILLAITGASGQIYASKLIEIIESSLKGSTLDIIYTSTAKTVWQDELGIPPHPSLDNNSYYHPYASGSNPADLMIIAPCTMSTLARVATGVGGDLITRAADVMLKERRKLIIVPRETPLNIIHLQNLTTLANAGAIIAPASPSFYTHPTTIDQLTERFARRLLQIAQLLELPQEAKFWA